MKFFAIAVMATSTTTEARTSTYAGRRDSLLNRLPRMPSGTRSSTANHRNPTRPRSTQAERALCAYSPTG